MPCQLPIIQLVDILAATPLNMSPEIAQTVCRGITTDTRNLKPGEVFLALRGERFDGHEFAAAAVEKGAIAVIVDRNSRTPLENIPQLHVNDTLQAYQHLARWWRDRFEIPVIAVTGSVGKTTTKELIAAVLSTQGTVLKSQANNNNEIGVPKTLLELGTDHDYAVIEMAMRGRGQIAQLTQIARPTIGMITTVGTAHIGLLGSVEAIAAAKCELLVEMPNTSVAILNHDNRLLMETAAHVWQGQTLTYGLEGGDLQGRYRELDTLEVEGRQFSLPLAGRHNALNYLAALAVAKVLQVDWTPLEAGITVELPSGRSRRYQLPGDLVLLDETYNAGLESMLAALQLLAETPGKRHIAVLGSMKELGEHSEELHRQVGVRIQELQLDSALILVSDNEAVAIAKGVSSVPVECFEDEEVLAQHLFKMANSGDRFLFKASRSVGLERVVKRCLDWWGQRPQTT